LDLIKKIHSYLSKDIDSMNEVIVDSLSVEEDLIQLVSNHLANAGGKRMRPILTLLTAKMFENTNDKAIRLAAAVEFIHMATLLHDDVVDGSKMRRFLPTANVVWGSKASILVGDFLFSQSFKLIVSTELLPALVALSNASAIIAEGEVSQLTKLEQKRIVTESEYLSVINAKTAELFGSACAVGAIVSGREDMADSLRVFGLRLGNIFQIADDALDYFSQSDKVGKNIGDDFYEGKVTLPLILLNSKASDADRVHLQKIIESPERTKDDFDVVLKLMQEYDIKQELADYLGKLKYEAISVLDNIDTKHEAKQYLNDLVEFAISRSY